MIKISLILIVVILEVAAPITAMAQSANATMRVSVQVVQSSSLEREEMRIGKQDNREQNKSGFFFFEGSDYDIPVINVPGKVTLTDNEGDDLNLGVMMQKLHQNGNDQFYIYFTGYKKHHNTYRGTVTATLQYL